MSNAFAKPTYVYKRFRVKRADGGSTTVSVDPALVVQACKVLGSLSEVSRIVREAAVKFVKGEDGAAKNRSAHVTVTLKAALKSKAEAAVAAPVEASTETAAKESVEQVAPAANDSVEAKAAAA